MGLRKTLINFTVDLIFGVALLPVAIVFHAMARLADGINWLHDELTEE